MEIGDINLIKREIVIGDIHGCLDELYELLGKLNYTPGLDQVYLLGDLLDRGPKGPEVVKLCREQGFLSVRGNHDDKHLRFRSSYENFKKTGKPMKMKNINASENLAMSKEDIDWLHKLPFCRFLTNGWVLVHAGFLPKHCRITRGKDQDTYVYKPDPQCMYVRYVTENGKGAMVDSINGFAQPPKTLNWYETWVGGNVLYGHSVHSFTDPKIYNNTIGIDTGCCFGGRLTAAVFPVGRDWPYFVQVQAKHEYSKFKAQLVND